MHPLRLKLKKIKLGTIEAIFMKKYFQDYKLALAKFAVNFELTPGLS